MRQRLRLAARACVCVTAFVVTSVSTAPAEEQAPKSLRDALRSLTLPDLDGKSVEVGKFLGAGPVILDFWATWCKPCLLAMPELQALYADLAPRGLRVVGINEDNPRNSDKVRPFLQANGYTFPVLLDVDREAQRRLQAIALPTTLVLDAKGIVLHSSFGYQPGAIDKLRTILEPHLTPPSR